MTCPVHKSEMLATKTRYGLRWSCSAESCTVACWGGETSTPADAETRALRHECHEAFDPLWRTKSRFNHRGHAYAWLRAFMGLSRSKAHIGMFTKEQCQKLLDHLKEPKE